MQNNESKIICLCPEIENLKILCFFQYSVPSQKNMGRDQSVLILGFIFPKNQSVGSRFSMFLYAGFHCIVFAEEI